MLVIVQRVGGGVTGRAPPSSRCPTPADQNKTPPRPSWELLPLPARLGVTAVAATQASLLLRLEKRLGKLSLWIPFLDNN